VEALHVPRLDVKAGEILAVVGDNGSGKSTLLETMAFLQRPDSGQILLDGNDVWKEGKPLPARRRCPILLQRTVLLKTTVLKNVMYPLRTRGLSRADARRRAEAVLRQVRLDPLAGRRYRELSGGERQRVALARLLVLEPEIVLLDEPTAHVDRDNERLIEQAIRQLHGRTGTTVILASHNARQAMTLADRVVTLVRGRLIPGAFDNLLTGTLRREGDGFVFHGTKGLSLQLAAEMVDFNGQQADVAADELVQIAIDADRLQLAPVAEAGDDAPGPVGEVESIRRHGDHCRLRVGLPDGHRMRCEMPIAEYRRLGINLGMTVRLEFAVGAVRLVPLADSQGV